MAANTTKAVIGQALLCLLSTAVAGRPLVSQKETSVGIEPHMFDGFVTSVSSQVRFTVGRMIMSVSAGTRCGELEVHSLLLGGTREKMRPCADSPINVGNFYRLWLEPDGTGSYRAMKMLTWDLSGHSYNRLESVQGDRLSGGAILEEMPDPPDGDGKQSVWIGGIPVEVDKSTRFFYSETLAKVDRVRYPVVSLGEGIGLIGRYPSESRSDGEHQLVPGMYVAYKAALQEDGKITTQKIVILPGSAVTNDQPQNMAPSRIEEPDYSKGVDGHIDLPYGPPVSLPADRMSQLYVQNLGEKLITELRNGHVFDRASQPIQKFYVTRAFPYDKRNALVRLEGQLTTGAWAGYRVTHPSDGTMVDWVSATADGIVLVPETALLKLRSDAELFFLLSTAVSSFLEQEASMVELLIKTSLDTGPHEEALEQLREMRMAMRLMYKSNMDFCDAPFAWSGSAYTNPQPTTLTPQQSAHPFYTEYAFDVIRNFYPDADCGALTRGEDQYAEFLTRLRKVIGQRPIEPPIPTR